MGTESSLPLSSYSAFPLVGGFISGKGKPLMVVDGVDEVDEEAIAKQSLGIARVRRGRIREGRE